MDLHLTLSIKCAAVAAIFGTNCTSHNGNLRLNLRELAVANADRPQPGEQIGFAIAALKGEPRQFEWTVAAKDAGSRRA